MCRRVNPSKNAVLGLQPKREVAGSPNFQVRSALVWIVCHWGNQPWGVKIVPPGDNFIVFSLLPSSSVTLGPRDPKFGTRVHLSKGYPNMHNLGFQKLGGQNFGFWFFFIFSLFLHNSSKKCWKWHFLKIQNFDPPKFLTPLTDTYFESPCWTVSMNQISWNFVEGCRS